MMSKRSHYKQIIKYVSQSILFFVLIMVTSPVYADNSSVLYNIPGIDSSIIDIFMQPGFDYSIRILNDISGTLQGVSSLAPRTSPYAEVTKNLITLFTRGMFSIALILFSYTTIIGTIYTATEGEVMGRKMQTYFILFRTFVAMALYFPMQNGYSLLQALITNVVITSVMVTNYAWYMVVSVMVTVLNGPLGVQLLSNVNEEFTVNQFVNNTETQVTNFVASTSKNYLEANSSAELASSAIVMGQLGQMICVYNNYYQAEGTSGISAAEQAITSMIYCSDSDCPFTGDGTTNISLTLPEPTSGQSMSDCGSINYTVNSDYTGSPAGSIIQPQLTQLSILAKTYFTNYVQNNKSISATDSSIGQTLASNLYSLVSDELLSQITTYSNAQQAASGNNTQPQDWINKLIDGGWAMAANNYFYYGAQLFSAADSLQQTVNYASYLYVTPAKSENFAFCKSNSALESVCAYLQNAGNNTLGGRSYCLIYPDSSNCPGYVPPQSQDKSSMMACAQNISQCANISQYLMANETSGGQTTVTAKDFVTVFYNGWKTQIPNINDVKSFAEIEAMTKLCNIPFATTSLNICESSGSFITPEEATPIFGAAVLATGIMMSVIPFRFALIGILAVFSAYYAGIAFYQNYVDIFTIWTDPSQLYPDTLALGLQSFTYFTVKAWYDTFANTQGILFVFPIQTMSAFGYRVLLYSVAFIFNVGTATFAANITMTMEMFFRQVVIDTAISLAQWYSAIPTQYGWWWIYSYFDLPFVVLSWQSMVKDTGLPLPCPIPIIIIIIFFPLFVSLIIGSILVSVGYVVNAITLAATMLEILNPAQIILEINSFIISKWNPLYFAIATPLISFATLFAFFLPIYPILVYILTVITWATQYIETLLAMPIILLGMANPQGHSPLLGKAEKAIMLLAVLFMRPLTTLMGFVIGNVLASISTFMFYQIIIPLLDMQIGSWAQGYTSLILGGTVGATKVLDTNDVTVQAVMTMLALIMFTMVFYYMILNAYSLIYKLPDAINQWIGINMAGNGKEEEILQQVSGETNNITGSLTSASTSIAGKQGEVSKAGGGLDAGSSYQQGKQSYQKDRNAGEMSGNNIFSSGPGREGGQTKKKK